MSISDSAHSGTPQSNGRPSLTGPHSAGSQIRSAALLGLASGLRAFSAPAALVLRRRPLTGPARAVLAAAAGELIADKLPSMPSRLQRRGLTGRVLSSAFAGHSVAGPAGAVTGVVSAVTSAVAGHRARAAISSPLGAFAEDWIAIALATLGASRRAGGRAEQAISTSSR
jgi:uncharacterized membrane protein